MKEKKNGLIGSVLGCCLTLLAAEGLLAQEGHLELSGRTGIGTDSIPLLQTSFNSWSYGIGKYNSASLTRWFDNGLALKFQATANLYSYPRRDFEGDPVIAGNQMFGVGLGVKANLMEATKGLFLQFSERLTYAQVDNTSWFGSYQEKDLCRTFALGTGLGFEYFLPFCDFISFSAYSEFLLCYNEGSNSIHYDPDDFIPDVVQNYSYLTAEVTVNGFNMNSMAVNFYF